MDDAGCGELAAAWVAYHHAPKRERDEYFWAWERLDDLIWRDPETAWPVIDRLYLLARGEPTFRKLLGAVWRNSIAEQVWQKLKSIARPEF